MGVSIGVVLIAVVTATIVASGSSSSHEDRSVVSERPLRPPAAGTARMTGSVKISADGVARARDPTFTGASIFRTQSATLA